MSDNFKSNYCAKLELTQLNIDLIIADIIVAIVEIGQS